MITKELLSHSLEKNIAALLQQQRDNGAINAYCSSRVLESALTLHLLKNQSCFPSKQAKIEHFLKESIANNNSNDSIAIEDITIRLAQQLIGQEVPFSKSLEPLLDNLLKRDPGRKTIYFGCLLAETGILPFSSLPFNINEFKTPKNSVQTWANVMLCSLKVLYCFGTSSESLITAKEKDFLLNKLFKSTIFENNVLTQIVGLIALSKILPKNQLEKPITALMKWQHKDGGMPLMTGLDNFVTPLVGLALLEALPNLTKKYQITVQTSIFKMTNYLALEQAENGGWSYMYGTKQTDMDDSGLCCALLAMVDGQKFETNLSKAKAYKVNMQNSDGGFPTYIKGNPSTPSMTAAALHGIAEMLQCNTLDVSMWKTSIQNALVYLLTIQNEDGTFERRWSNANTHAMFRVAVALRSIQKIDRLLEFHHNITIISNKITNYLHKEQNPDGGWGRTPGDTSDIISTGYAILCCTKLERKLATNGIQFLWSQQNKDTRLKCSAELLGPRPLPYEIPILPTFILTYAYSYFSKLFLKKELKITSYE